MVLCCLLSGAVSGSAADVVVTTPSEPEFRFARLAYNDNSALGGFGRGRGRGSWTTDAPEAEMHLLTGIRRLTRINTLDPARDQFIALRPDDPDIYAYPFIYGVEVGRWYLSDEEAANLREYLLRGGFLMVDDFHGSLQWEGFMESMRRVFPDREVVEIPDEHEVFHVLYDLDHKVQIPGVFALMSGVTYEQDGTEPHWRGVFDDHGRLMVAINFNMDLGDAWEHADTPEYPQPLTALAYRFAISYAIYAMSH
jgi:Domain of unknown function (DUF4159)